MHGKKRHKGLIVAQVKIISFCKFRSFCLSSRPLPRTLLASMTSIASQLPPPVQSGLYGLPARSDAATAFPAAVSLSYLKMGTQVLGTQLLPCESVVSLAKTTPPTTIVKSDGIPFASMFPGSGAPAELSVLLEKYNQLAIQESCLLQSLRCAFYLLRGESVSL